MLKLGVIDVLNVLPVYYAILTGKIKIECDLVHGKVTELNQKLNSGEIDISVISSFEYALNQDKYLVFPNLSVSANGRVKSIYLFLDLPWDEVRGKTIYLTAFSLTSVHLIRFLMRDLDIHFTHDSSAPRSGELLIADAAISRFYEKKWPYVYDLAELWKKETGLPFVFALWAVTKESYQNAPKEVRQVCRKLLESRDLAAGKFQEMAARYNKGIFPSTEACTDYLQNLEYDLTPDFIKGFYLFQEKMVELGNLEEVARLNFLQIDD